MNYFIALVSLSVGLYSLQLIFDIVESKFRITQNNVVNFCSCFLFLTFPFINFANSFDIIFFQSYVFSYICGIYGFAFIVFSFVLPKEKSNEIIES